jgi:hypothetical protein
MIVKAILYPGFHWGDERGEKSRCDTVSAKEKTGICFNPYPVSYTKSFPEAAAYTHKYKSRAPCARLLDVL